MASHAGRITSAPPASLWLQWGFSAQVTHEGLRAVSNEAPGQAEPETCSSVRRKQKYELWEAPCCQGWTPASPAPTWCLEMFAACQEFRSRAPGCQFDPQIIPYCCSSLWAPTLVGETLTVARMTYLRRKPRAQGPSWHLLDSSSEREGLDEKWMDLIGQQTVVQPVLTTGINFYKLGILSEIKISST